MIAWSSTTRTDRVVSLVICSLPHCRAMPGYRESCGKLDDSPAKFLNERLRLPAQEVADQAQAGRLALFRMELRADEIVAPDHGGDRPAIVGGGKQGSGVRGLELEGVHEIGVVARLHAFEQ